MEAIVLLGAPGAGKGTAARGLEESTAYRHISTGDLFRVTMHEDTVTGRAIRPYMEQGQLVPDELVMGVVSEMVRTGAAEGKILFDGFPRTVGQAEAFDNLLDRTGSRLVAAFLLDADRDVLIERLSGRMICPGCGTIYHAESKPPKHDGQCDHCTDQLLRREDDDPDTIRKRLQVYDELTAPLVAYYRGSGLLRRIDAEAGPEAVRREISEGLLAAG